MTSRMTAPWKTLSTDWMHWPPSNAAAHTLPPGEQPGTSRSWPTSGADAARAATRSLGRRCARGPVAVLENTEQYSAGLGPRLYKEVMAAAETLATLRERGRMVPELHDGRTREIFGRDDRLMYEVSRSRRHRGAHLWPSRVRRWVARALRG